MLGQNMCEIRIQESKRKNMREKQRERERERELGVCIT